MSLIRHAVRVVWGDVMLGMATICLIFSTGYTKGPTLRRKVVDRCRALWVGHPGRGAALMKCGWMKRFENEYRERSRNLS
jgi:hypothetical protein